MGRGARLRHTGSPMADSTLVMPARVRDQTCRGDNVRRRHFTLGVHDPAESEVVTLCMAIETTISPGEGI